ncbi:mannosyl phosphorylinositol ceramide synthase SUR1 [Penicillium lividum]|nr:mannosyl phosphorylinositol ceramide synthase SUR1 [Penicillium lividum]
MLATGMEMNENLHTLNWVTRWKASILVASLSPGFHNFVSRRPLFFGFVSYVFFLCASLSYSSIQFASALQVNSFNADALSPNTSQAKTRSHNLASGLASPVPVSSNNTSKAPNHVAGDIPRIIHRMWRDSGSSAPNEWINASNSCQEQNPSYTQYVWTDDTAHQFIETHFTWFLSTYTEHLLPLQQTDALRYFLLLHFGGIYMDPEIGCQYPMEPLLRGTRAVFPQSWPYGVSQRWIASKANHPFLMKVALSIHEHRSFVPEYLAAMFNTGSILVSRIAARWLSLTSYGQDITFLPPELFAGTDNAIFIIHEPQMPLGDEFFVSQFLFENPLGWCGAAVMLGVMSTVVFGIRSTPGRIRDPMPTSLIV